MPDPTDDAFDALRAAGAAKRDAGVRDAAAREEARAVRRLDAGRRATSPFGVMASSLWWTVVATVGGLGAVFAVLGLLFPTKQIVGGTMETHYFGTGMVVVGVAAAFAITIIIARSAVARAVAREVTWASELPFKLDGHLNVLESGYGDVRLAFVATAPDRATLEPLVAGIAGFRCELQDDAVTIRLQPDRSAPKPHDRWRAWHGVVDKFLVPLHARYPLASVTIPS